MFAAGGTVEGAAAAGGGAPRDESGTAALGGGAEDAGAGVTAGFVLRSAPSGCTGAPSPEAWFNALESAPPAGKLKCTDEIRRCRYSGLNQ